MNGVQGDKPARVRGGRRDLPGHERAEPGRYRPILHRDRAADYAGAAAGVGPPGAHRARYPHRLFLPRPRPLCHRFSSPRPLRRQPALLRHAPCGRCAPAAAPVRVQFAWFCKAHLPCPRLRRFCQPVRWSTDVTWDCSVNVLHVYRCLIAHA